MSDQSLHEESTGLELTASLAPRTEASEEGGMTDGADKEGKEGNGIPCPPPGLIFYIPSPSIKDERSSVSLSQTQSDSDSHSHSETLSSTDSDSESDSSFKSIKTFIHSSRH